jgi:hypothetical protein
MSEDECMEILYHRFGKEVQCIPVRVWRAYPRTLARTSQPARITGSLCAWRGASASSCSPLPCAKHALRKGEGPAKNVAEPNEHPAFRNKPPTHAGQKCAPEGQPTGCGCPLHVEECQKPVICKKEHEHSAAKPLFVVSRAAARRASIAFSHSLAR